MTMSRWFCGFLTSLNLLTLWELASPSWAQIHQDRSLPHSSVVRSRGKTTVITGGTQSGTNLFHSFREFSVPTEGIASFQGVAPSIANIFARITGTTPSHINGTIEVRQRDGAISRANFVLLNPNGIIFGPHAALNMGGSFLATTANSIRFRDGTQFSAHPSQAPPLLTVSAPIGLQFGHHPGRIRNQSIVPVPTSTGHLASDALSIPRGLSVSPGRTLALVGGDIDISEGGLFAPGGRIELGSVTHSGAVRLDPTSGGWALGYDGVQSFGDIQLSGSALVDTRGAGGGPIQVQGRHLSLGDGSQIGSTTLGARGGAPVHIAASASVAVDGTSTDGTPSQIYTLAETGSTGQAGRLVIETERLSVRNGAAIETTTLGRGRAGNLIIRATDQVEVAGSDAVGSPSVLDTSTGLPTGESETTERFGRAGDLRIVTGLLTVRDGAEVSVGSNSVRSLLGAGTLQIQAQAILLDNQGKLVAVTEAGRGGNINLQVQALLLRHESQISSTAGVSRQGGAGGNITIDARDGFIIAVPSENSDISANAYRDRGGRVEITAQYVFGLKPRSIEELQRQLGTHDPDELLAYSLQTSDITAVSQTSPRLSGQVTFNTPEIDPGRGLVSLPMNLLDGASQIIQQCRTGDDPARGEFIITGRGGLPATPSDLHTSETVLTNWAVLTPEADPSTFSGSALSMSTPSRSENSSMLLPTPSILEAQGWVVDEDGKVLLVAQAPTVPSHYPTLDLVGCPANY